MRATLQRAEFHSSFCSFLKNLPSLVNSRECVTRASTGPCGCQENLCGVLGEAHESLRVATVRASGVQMCRVLGVAWQNASLERLFGEEEFRPLLFCSSLDILKWDFS